MEQESVSNEILLLASWFRLSLLLFSVESMPGLWTFLALLTPIVRCEIKSCRTEGQRCNWNRNKPVVEAVCSAHLQLLCLCWKADHVEVWTAFCLENVQHHELQLIDPRAAQKVFSAWLITRERRLIILQAILMSVPRMISYVQCFNRSILSRMATSIMTSN